MRDDLTWSDWVKGPPARDAFVVSTFMRFDVRSYRRFTERDQWGDVPALIRTWPMEYP